MSNEAAERLRKRITGVSQDVLDDLDAALAAERRATVERIRVALGIGTIPPTGSMLYHAQAVDSITRISEILDAAAAR